MPGMMAEYGGGAEILHLVVLGRAGPVSVDVVDLIESQIRINKRVTNAVGDRLAIRIRTSTMEVSANSPQPAITPRILAPRDCAACRLSSTSAPQRLRP